MSGARESFALGDRVVLSAVGLQTLHLRNRRGLPGVQRGEVCTVVGFGRDGFSIRVRRRGAKRPDTYAAAFWELAP